ncbi:C40 family peptidase [Streptomyces sp. CHA1]|nr:MULTISPECIES: C40 family peptidase [unclassified Streptomyces]WDV33324.1 C40 family peptidase [Streptomyces sp. AD16]MBT3155813.1 C40 family peptidase [Streptomyces sp. G11C]MCO6703329.1 C40 family peptidase [Streptomyces sp. CHB9.2]MCO6709690.1 C40 family peptidase [Streptomyces sp. CHA3]MCO6715434.1 C40 family peptidase [Streptomyces sp. CHB19.2]
MTAATALSAAAATAAATLGGAAPAQAEPGPAATRASVERLLTEAERATEAFNEADERTGALRAELHRTQDRVARGQDRVNTMRGALGALAGAQYRSGGVDPALELIFSSDPEQYLEKAATLDRISLRRAGELNRLTRAQRLLTQERAEAAATLAELTRSRAATARHKRTVEAKLARARALLAALPAGERDAHDRRASRSDRPDLAGVALSGRAGTAVAAARRALGKPYVWGANGPVGFDCSGLMQWAYAQAGVALPRTSQAQRYAGRHVPLSQARPGDLVTYRADASHVGMYVGNGQVVHAPYPGASVRYDPVGMMPIASVTRV